MSDRAHRPFIAHVLALLAGPLLIVGLVLAVLHDFAFNGLISSQQVDVLGFFLPTHCVLGRALATGHVPGWNPSVMTGASFAADPQSGWGYLLPMLLYSMMGCDVAIRWFVVAQPLIGGLGLYAFLRSEGLARPAAALGGLAMALGLVQAKIALALPFSASLAWTAVLLAAASRLMNAHSWSGRIAWVTLTAIVWGQIAAAHLSNGQLMGTGALVLYLLAAVLREISARRLTAATAGAIALLLASALLLVNLAVLLPRAEYLPRTTLSAGYPRLVQLDRAAAGGENPDREGRAMPVMWPLKFTTSPGAYFGALVLVLALGALWSRRRKALAVTLIAYLAGSWILSTQAVADVVSRELRGMPFADQLYSHQPWRFGVVLFLLIPILAGIGLEAWLDNASRTRRTAMLAPGVVVWGLLPIALGIPTALLERLFVGAVAGAIALLLTSLSPRLAIVVPLFVALELTASAFAGQQMMSAESKRPSHYHVGTSLPSGFVPLRRPRIDAAAYVAEVPFARQIARGSGRFLTYGEYHPMQAPSDWPALGDERGMLFGIEDAQTYNPAQPPRYWRFVRAVNAQAPTPEPINYNLSYFVHPTAATMDLLGVRWVIARAGQRSQKNWEQASRDGAWVLYRRDFAATRATVFPSWTVANSPELALRDVTASGFDPRTSIVTEANPGVSSAGEGEAIPARYRELGPEHAVVSLSTPEAAVVLVRNTYDPHWHATVDGHPAPILVGDYFLQAIAVPAGAHTINLQFDDPWIGIGLAGSALSLIALLGSAVLLAARERREPSNKEEIQRSALARSN
ncbi:MAG: YfhO family protein [Actinomycetota bacterium]|nr:YfhO family protein [Actinomycetota bacterium]